MAGRHQDDLDRLEATQDLRLQSEHRDGTLRDPETTCVARAEDAVCVGSVQGGAWFRGTQTRKHGRLHAGGVSKDVCFNDADPDVIYVYAAHQAKYAAFADSLDRSMTPRLRAAILQLVQSWPAPFARHQ